MSLKIRRGTDAERLTITPAEGELIYTTDTKELYIGDGSTVGGNLVTSEGGGGGNGYTGSASTVVGYTGSASTVVGYTGSASTVVGYTGSGATGYTGSFSGTLQSNLSLSTYSITGTNLTISGTGIVTDTIYTPDSSNSLVIFTHTNNNLNLNYYNGTKNNPTTVITGSNLGNLTFRAYNGTIYKGVGGLNVSLNNSAILTTEYPSAVLRLFIGNNSSNPVMASLDNTGVFTAPILQPGVYATATARDSAITAPSAGMIIFLTTGAKFQGYDGSNWVDLN